jgi:hypothetical protein
MLSQWRGREDVLARNPSRELGALLAAPAGEKY